MAFTIDDALLPATLTSHPMSDEEFAAFCGEHPDLFFEMTAEADLIVMPPSYSTTGARNQDLGYQLSRWAKKNALGVSTDSSTGFVLPNGARRSPDAAWTLKSRIGQLSEKSREGFWHLCPDFVVELRSATDRPRALKLKMLEYLEQGAQLGWLIDPANKSVTIFRAGQEPGLRSGVDSIAGEGPVEEFVLDLETIWNPLA